MCRDELRAHLKSVPKPVPQQTAAAEESSSSDSDSSDSSDDSGLYSYHDRLIVWVFYD